MGILDEYGLRWCRLRGYNLEEFTLSYNLLLFFFWKTSHMGSCSSIDENKVGSPGHGKDVKVESGNQINTYPSIEDVIRMEKLKKKKNSRQCSQ